MFHTEVAQVLHATVQNFVATMTWHPEFMHPFPELSSACYTIRRNITRDNIKH